MLRSWRLGTAFGIGSYVHWCFPLLLAFLLLMNAGGGLLQALVMLLLVLAVFGCVVLHELGHALMARHFGIPTRDITLYPIGGVARLERMSEKPWEEFWIALAGPAVNVAIVGILAVLLGDFGLILQPLHDVVLNGAGMENYSPIGQLMVILLLLNRFLALFNLIPAFPMDGGRVLRALLSVGFGQLRATEIATVIGSVLVAFGIMTGLGLVPVPGLNPDRQTLPMLVLLSAFVFFFGQQELAMVRYKTAARQRPPVDVVPAQQFLDVSAIPAEPNFSGFTWDRRAHAWVEWREGRPVHVCWVDAE